MHRRARSPAQFTCRYCCAWSIPLRAPMTFGVNVHDSSSQCRVLPPPVPLAPFARLPAPHTLLLPPPPTILFRSFHRARTLDFTAKRYDRATREGSCGLATNSTAPFGKRNASFEEWTQNGGRLQNSSTANKSTCRDRRRHRRRRLTVTRPPAWDAVAPIPIARPVAWSVERDRREDETQKG